MQYFSTRNNQQVLGFDSILYNGLANDGGLYVPEHFPNLWDDINAITGKNLPEYQEVALLVFKKFMESSCIQQELNSVINKSYHAFKNTKVTPVVQYAHESVLELFHGPTLAFKDIALQFLGQVMSLIPNKKQYTTVLAATSGDTGGAAVAGLSNVEHCQVFVLYPKGRVSKIQELQMIVGTGSNVFPLEFSGSFDEAQNIVKALFADTDFKEKTQLTSVNSINWCRIMAQMVYYFYAGLQQQLLSKEPLSFSVPTGNFGDVLAGYYAHLCGLPVEQFIVACNSNDIIARTYEEGVYRPGTSQMTLSPAMDIQVASNFERLLFELYDRDSNKVCEKMLDLKQQGFYVLDTNVLDKFRQKFQVYSVSNEETASAMKTFAEKGVTVDPHTAVGLVAAEKSGLNNVLTLSTAHPVKFKETVESVTEQDITLPPAIETLYQLPEKKFPISNDLAEVKAFILEKLPDNRSSIH